MLPVLEVGEIQPIPDSRMMDDLMGSGELDKSLSLSGGLWPDITGLATMFCDEQKEVLAVTVDGLLVSGTKRRTAQQTTNVGKYNEFALVT